MDHTTTLADALLDDLDDLDDVGSSYGDDDKDNDNDNEDVVSTCDSNEETKQKQMEVVVSEAGENDDNDDTKSNEHRRVDGGSNFGGEKGNSGEFVNNKSNNKNRKNNNNNDVLFPRLLNDPMFQEHLQAIRKVHKCRVNSIDNIDNNSNSNTNSKSNNDTTNGHTKNDNTVIIDREYEHKLIVQTNKQLVNITNEMIRIHKEICTVYRVKFPELEELVPNIYQYIKVVRIIWNEMDMTSITDSLSSIVSNNQIITISVAGSTTIGRPLQSNELDLLDTLVSYCEQLRTIQNELEQFVEGRMEQLAPSLCAVIGSTSIASKLLGLTGGLYELAKIPSCNIQVLGQSKQNSSSRSGLSTMSTKPHHGILMECTLIQQCPRYIQTKVLKIVSAKVALAARCDWNAIESGRIPTSNYGIQLRTEIELKINKLQEPDKAQVLKALPKPDMTVKKRRGGKRMRRLKERYEETTMMKQANTRAFSAQVGEYGDDAMGLTLGLLDTAEITAGGALRKNNEKKKMKYANTRESRKRNAQQQQQLQKTHDMNKKMSSSNSGLASSMVFTPVQGMELINPDANKVRVQEANRMWFHENAGFQSAKPKT